MTDFATDPGATVTPMTPTEMVDGFVCGTMELGQLNWLFNQLFAGTTASYIDCNGAPIADGDAIMTCAHPYRSSRVSGQINVNQTVTSSVGDSYDAFIAGFPAVSHTVTNPYPDIAARLFVNGSFATTDLPFADTGLVAGMEVLVDGQRSMAAYYKGGINGAQSSSPVGVESRAITVADVPPGGSVTFTTQVGGTSAIGALASLSVNIGIFQTYDCHWHPWVRQ